MAKEEEKVNIKEYDNLESRVNLLERDNIAMDKEINRFYKIDGIMGKVQEYSAGLGLLGVAILGVYCAADELSSADMCMINGAMILTSFCVGVFAAAKYIKWAYKRNE